MKILPRIHASVLGGLLVGMLLLSAGCAGTATRSSTGEYIDDTVITARVKAALVGDEVVKARDVQVETFRGVVQLSGFVDNATQKSRASEIASGIVGVKSVKNDIHLK